MLVVAAIQTACLVSLISVGSGAEDRKVTMSQTPPFCSRRGQARPRVAPASSLLSDVSKHILSSCVKPVRVIGGRCKVPGTLRRERGPPFSTKILPCSDV